MLTDYEKLDANACVKEDGQFKPDPLWDDQSLFIKSERGLIIILELISKVVEIDDTKIGKGVSFQ